MSVNDVVVGREAAVLIVVVGCWFAIRKWFETVHKKKLMFESLSKDDKPSSNATLSLFPSNDDEQSSITPSSDDIVLITPIVDTGYEYCMEKAKCSLVSILALSNHDTDEKYRYYALPWSLLPSGTMSYLWTCHSEHHGILLRTSVTVKASAKTVLQWLVNRNILTGLETASSENVLIKSFHGNSMSVRRICCDSGPSSRASFKRDFVVVTSISMLPDGAFVVASRSIYIPDHITIHHRKGRNGYVRGIIYTSGFVLRPIKDVNDDKTEGNSLCHCEVSFATHMDMLGTMTEHANMCKLEELKTSVISIMERIDEYFTFSCPGPQSQQQQQQRRRLTVLRSLKPSCVVAYPSCACPNLLQLDNTKALPSATLSKKLSTENKTINTTESGLNSASVAHTQAMIPSSIDSSSSSSSTTTTPSIPLITLTIEQQIQIQSAACNAIAQIRCLHESLCNDNSSDYNDVHNSSDTNNHHENTHDKSSIHSTSSSNYHNIRQDDDKNINHKGISTAYSSDNLEYDFEPFNRRIRSRSGRYRK